MLENVADGMEISDDQNSEGDEAPNSTNKEVSENISFQFFVFEIAISRTCNKKRRRQNVESKPVKKRKGSKKKTVYTQTSF